MSTKPIQPASTSASTSAKSSSNVTKPSTASTSAPTSVSKSGSSSRPVQTCNKLNTGEQSVIQSVKAMKTGSAKDEELSKLGQELEESYSTCKNKPVCNFPENFYNYVDIYNEFYELLYSKCEAGKKSTYLEYIRMLKRHSDKISAFQEIADNIIDIEAEVIGDETDLLNSL